MFIVILPVITMGIGFLLGVITMDTFVSDDRIDQLERKVKRLERRARG